MDQCRQDQCFLSGIANRAILCASTRPTCVTDTFGPELCSQVNTTEDANGFLINPVGERESRRIPTSWTVRNSAKQAARSTRASCSSD
jgi:hypothetical protein